ncbi:MAG: MarR family transcriptional regulator, partial [Ktedonobacteraceae bacterium]
MSSGSQKKQTEVRGELAHELRQCYGLGASFFRSAAARIEMTDTDMQVMDILESTGEASAGTLADLMGLTTGTFTGILNRLEKARLVSRERDPNDGRRVIVRLTSDKDDMHKIGPLFDSIGQAWDEL